jgi:hypothetical protein
MEMNRQEWKRRNRRMWWRLTVAELWSAIMDVFYGNRNRY